jgi:hypothetical protein
MVMTDEDRKVSRKVREWRHDPVKFVRECLHAEPDPWQLDVLDEVPYQGIPV